jgi:hypothetical protein
MSTWNYRVIERSGEFAIHEVFYDAAGTVTGWTEMPVYPRAESVEDLRLELARYAGAIEQPVIVEEQ